MLKFSIIMDLSVVAVLPSLSAVGSWEEVLLFYMGFTVSQNFFGVRATECKFLLEKAGLCFPD